MDNEVETKLSVKMIILLDDKSIRFTKLYVLILDTTYVYADYSISYCVEVDIFELIKRIGPKSCISSTGRVKLNCWIVLTLEKLEILRMVIELPIAYASLLPSTVRL